ncbi:MAG: hypothetical protein LBR50_11560 [Tannerella sp.]|jgi:LEA14-like dessication related protein|nr:hypothetical protein [Tannerella sp.]
MRRNILFKTVIVAALFMLTGCDLAQMLQSAYNLKNCEYKYHSISNLKLSNTSLSGAPSALEAIQLLAALNGLSSSLPLDFTLNLDVHNPHETTAGFSALDYIIAIDNIEFTNGSLNQAFSVGSGDTQVLPIRIGVDIVKLANEHSKDAVIKIVKNFIGIGDSSTNVSVKLKPSFNMGSKIVQSPVYLPVDFSFGGKK